MLLNAGANIEGRDEHGRTPLHSAASNIYYPKVILTLLAAGADVNARDEDGATPLFHAVEYAIPLPEYGRPEIIRLLKEAGGK